jgi:hypothetical protein
MPIPNADRAVVPTEKVTEYLLNPLHPVGGPKARWLFALGYRLESPEELANDLLGVVRTSEDFTMQADRFGVKFVVKGLLTRPNGRSARVLTIWMMEHDTSFPRLVSAFPTRSE